MSDYQHAYLIKFVGSEWNFLRALSREYQRPISQIIRLCVLKEMGWATSEDFDDKEYKFPID